MPPEAFVCVGGGFVVCLSESVFCVYIRLPNADRWSLICQLISVKMHPFRVPHAPAHIWFTYAWMHPPNLECAQFVFLPRCVCVCLAIFRADWQDVGVSPFWRICTRSKGAASKKAIPLPTSQMKDAAIHKRQTPDVEILQ